MADESSPSVAGLVGWCADLEQAVKRRRSRIMLRAVALCTLAIAAAAVAHIAVGALANSEGAKHP